MLTDKIMNQLELLAEESRRVKTFLNENGFDCTTAPFAIVKRYRTELKEHMKVLHMNLVSGDE